MSQVEYSEFQSFFPFWSWIETEIETQLGKTCVFITRRIDFSSTTLWKKYLQNHLCLYRSFSTLNVMLASFFLLSDQFLPFNAEATLCANIPDYSDYLLTSFRDESVEVTLKRKTFQSVQIFLRCMYLFCFSFFSFLFAACDEQWQALLWVLRVWHHYWRQAEAVAYRGEWISRQLCAATPKIFHH